MLAATCSASVCCSRGGGRRAPLPPRLDGGDHGGDLLGSGRGLTRHRSARRCLGSVVLRLLEEPRAALCKRDGSSKCEGFARGRACARWPGRRLAGVGSGPWSSPSSPAAPSCPSALRPLQPWPRLGGRRAALRIAPVTAGGHPWPDAVSLVTRLWLPRELRVIPFDRVGRPWRRLGSPRADVSTVCSPPRRRIG